MSIAGTVGDLNTLAEETIITRANFERLLDQGQIEAHMKNGNWWQIRRNGQTQTWKKDAKRIRTPIKMGLRTYGAIVETDFDERGRLNPVWYRRRIPA